MSSTFFGLNIGKTGLYAYQAALDATSHNIANTETEGYTRQVISQTAGNALKTNSRYGMVGTGVSVADITQERNEYYDMKYWKNNTRFGEYSTKEHYMTEVENYLNEFKLEGFTTSFNSMYDSLQELSKNPSSLTVRTQVTQYAQSLCEYFNSLATNLKAIQSECNFEIKNKVDQINSTAQQVAALTKQINTLEIGGGTANDLRDQRALLVDELSEILDISVTEITVGDGIGLTDYTIKINGQTLVDGANFNTLKAIPRVQRQNQNDIDGLYDISWSNGQEFQVSNTSLGGTLQALFEVRDGNNANNLRGTVTAEASDQHVTVTNTNFNNVEKLNIPETGKITLDDRDYVYTGFEVAKDDETGNYIYTFELEQAVMADVMDGTASIGDNIDYKGIPYYMAQMNEFVRTYAKNFNEMHREGQDLKGSVGMDFFTATNRVNGREYTFGPLKGDPDEVYYEYNSFNSNTGGYAETVEEDEPFYGAYYFMTIDNFKVNDDIYNDPDKLATTSNISAGIEGNDIVEKLLGLKSDVSMFKQGAPSAFLQTIVAEVGIDTKKAVNFSDSQKDILESITNQRLSVSGVDIDEEAMNLVRYQNAYKLSAKVVSVMDEIYDRLINYMGV